jgi:hypothetical protein
MVSTDPFSGIKMDQSMPPGDTLQATDSCWPAVQAGAARRRGASRTTAHKTFLVDFSFVMIFSFLVCRRPQSASGFGVNSCVAAHTCHVILQHKTNRFSRIR